MKKQEAMLCTCMKWIEMIQMKIDILSRHVVCIDTSKCSTSLKNFSTSLKNSFTCCVDEKGEH